VAHGASALGAGVTILATAALALVTFMALARHPPAFVPGRKISWPGFVGVVAMVQACCVVGFWGAVDQADPEFSTGDAALVAFVVLPALIVPLTLLSLRFGRLPAYVQTCRGCDGSMSPRGSHCGHCGIKQ
jgi:hypothetical protein